MWLWKEEQWNSDTVTSCEEPVLLKQYLVLFYGAFESGLFVEKNVKMHSKEQKNWNQSTLNLMWSVYLFILLWLFIVASFGSSLYDYYNSVVCCLVSDRKKFKLKR